MRISLPLLTGVVLMSLSLSAQAGGAEISRTSIRESIARWWDSIESIEVRMDRLQSYDERGEVLIEEHHIAVAAGEKVSVKVVQTTRTGEKVVAANTRTDGLKTYQGATLEGHPEVSKTINVMNSASRPGHYVGPMDTILWLIMPGGTPLHRHLDEGADLLVDENPDGGKSYSIQFNFRYPNRPVKCILDPEHDWLPREVEIGTSGTYRIRVTRFLKENGHFFPAAGTIHKMLNTGEHDSRFEVRAAAINRGAAPELFGPPNLVMGTFIVDQTKGKNHIQGGLKGREAFRAKYELPSSAPVASKLPANPVVAGREPERSPIATTILVASTFVLIVAAYLRKRAS